MNISRKYLYFLLPITFFFIVWPLLARLPAPKNDLYTTFLNEKTIVSSRNTSTDPCDPTEQIHASISILHRLIGEDASQRVHLELCSSASSASKDADKKGVIEETDADVFELIEYSWSTSIADSDCVQWKGLYPQVTIRANSAIALNRGIGYYSHTYCSQYLTWPSAHLASSSLSSCTPANKSQSFQDIRFIATKPLRYYLNYCTLSYSMAYWSRERWQYEIDWMAIRGINSVLVTNGMAKVWLRTLMRLNSSKEEARQFLSGPTYSAWWLMGNIEGEGATLTDEYIERDFLLAKFIIRSLFLRGIEPVLPLFYGMVPRAWIGTSKDVHDVGAWIGHPRPAYVDACGTDGGARLFEEAAAVYYDELSLLIDTSASVRYYAGDPLHEAAAFGGRSWLGCNMTCIAANIMRTLKEHTNDNSSTRAPIWLIQAWMENPSVDLMAGLERNDAIILDLEGEFGSSVKKVTPMYQSRERFAWGIVPSFGARQGLHGRVDFYAMHPYANQYHSLISQNLVGVAAIMEGIGENEFIYDLLFDAAWQPTPLRHSLVDSLSHSLTYLHARISDRVPRQYVDGGAREESLDAYLLRRLLQVTRRRYGEMSPKIEEAWTYLFKSSVFRCRTNLMGPVGSIAVKRPSLTLNPNADTSIRPFWDNVLILDALNSLLKAIDTYPNVQSRGGQALLHDALDVARQYLNARVTTQFTLMRDSFQKSDTNQFERESTTFIALLEAVRDLLKSRCSSSLHCAWLCDADALAYYSPSPKISENEEKYDRILSNSLMSDALAQVTVWHSDFRRSSPLVSYAAKDWWELYETLYIPRWKHWISSLSLSLTGGNAVKSIDFEQFDEQWRKAMQERFDEIRLDCVQTRERRQKWRIDPLHLKETLNAIKQFL